MVRETGIPAARKTEDIEEWAIIFSTPQTERAPMEKVMVIFNPYPVLRQRSGVKRATRLFSIGCIPKKKKRNTADIPRRSDPEAVDIQRMKGRLMAGKSK